MSVACHEAYVSTNCGVDSSSQFSFRERTELMNLRTLGVHWRGHVGNGPHAPIIKKMLKIGPVYSEIFSWICKFLPVVPKVDKWALSKTHIGVAIFHYILECQCYKSRTGKRYCLEIGDVATYYVLPVLWMTSCVHIMAVWPNVATEHRSITAQIPTKLVQNDKDQQVIIVSLVPAGGRSVCLVAGVGEVWYWRLPWPARWNVARQRCGRLPCRSCRWHSEHMSSSVVPLGLHHVGPDTHTHSTPSLSVTWPRYITAIQRATSRL